MNALEELRDSASSIIAAVEKMDFCSATNFAAMCWEGPYSADPTRSPGEIADQKARFWTFIPYGRKVMGCGLSPNAPKDMFAAYSRICDLFDLLIAKFDYRDRRALKFVRSKLIACGDTDDFRTAICMGCAFEAKAGPLAGYAKLREDTEKRDYTLAGFKGEFSELDLLAARKDWEGLRKAGRAFIARWLSEIELLRSLQADYTRIFGKENRTINENIEQVMLTIKGLKGEA